MATPFVPNLIFVWDLLLGLAGLAGWLGLPGLAGWFQICPGNRQGGAGGTGRAWLAGFKFARGTSWPALGEPAGSQVITGSFKKLSKNPLGKPS